MIRYQRCEGCGHVFYFARDFCPACGNAAVPGMTAAGGGTIAAVTLVHRAPTKAWQAHAPYLLCLVEMDEGFRVMGHGEPSLAIGDRVSAAMVRLDGIDQVVPFFTR